MISNNYIVEEHELLPSTLSTMRRLEKLSLTKPDFIKFVLTNFDKNCKCIYEGLWKWIRTNCTYVSDEENIHHYPVSMQGGNERIIAPHQFIKVRQGDCDDFSLFIKTVLDYLGIESYYILFSKSGDKDYTHIAVFANGNIIDACNPVYNNFPKNIYKSYELIQ